MERALLKWFCPFYFKKAKEIKKMLDLYSDKFQKVYEIKGTTVLATDDNLIVTTATMANSAYTIAAQPLAASKITIKHTASSTVDTLGVITIVGSLFGVAQTEVITPLNGATATSTKYFDAITSITGSGWAAGATADSIIVGVGADALIRCAGRAISFYNVSGNIWINPNGTAAANSTSFPMIAAGSIDLLVSGNLSIITDGTGGSFKYIIWE